MMKVSKDYKYKILPTHNLSLGKLSFAEIQSNHLERIRRWRNAQMKILRQTKEISQQEQKSYFRDRVFSELVSDCPKQILVGIEWNEKFVGYGGLVHIDWNARKAEVSFLLDTKIKEGSQLFVDIFSCYLQLVQIAAFEKLELNRISTETYSFRTSVISTLNANGFLLEGTLRETYFWEGRFFNSLIHSKLIPKDRNPHRHG